MDRDTMLKRLAAGYDPIDVSIEKWRDGNDLRFGGNCALCEVYECEECPLAQIDECCGDGAFYRAIEEDDPEIMIKALEKAKEWQRKERCKEVKKSGQRKYVKKNRSWLQSDRHINREVERWSRFR